VRGAASMVYPSFVGLRGMASPFYAAIAAGQSNSRPSLAA
jgi:hypothetical protein